MARRRRVRANPDTSQTLLNVALVGVVGLGAVTVLQAMQRGQSIGDAIGQIPIIGGLLKPGGGGGPTHADPCGFNVHQGNTSLSLVVQPWNPPRQLGEPVVYSGRLTDAMLGRGLGGARIDFYDTRDCSEPFASMGTDQAGYYSFESTLYPQDLDGYGVFAHFPGSFAWGGLRTANPALTGVWQVRPGA